jgi:hypothetical protein
MLTPDELEVSIFGPGVGECIALHLGAGEWAVVDSCIDRASGEPVALRYLRDLGVDPAIAVKLIVVTHWHDDHIAGSAALFRACRAAEVVCSVALQSREFYSVVALGKRSLEKDSGVAELGGILDELKARAPHQARPLSIGPRFVTSDTCVWNRPNMFGTTVSIHALSPSSGAVQRALHGFAALMPPLRSQKGRIATQGPNDAAVVLLVQAGPHAVLLGSDLETTRDPLTGWTAILNSTTRPLTLALAFKVAHHGSANADHADIWTKLLARRPHLALTPFRRGAVPLPRADDIARLKERTPFVFVTAPTRGAAPVPRDALVERMTKRERRVLFNGMGHIRFRWPLTRAADPEVMLAAGAFQA